MTHRVSLERPLLPPEDQPWEASTEPSPAGRSRPGTLEANPTASANRVVPLHSHHGPTPEGWPGSGETHHASDEAWLRSVLSGPHDRDLPARRTPEPPAAKRWVWRLWLDVHAAFPACTPLRRHPELDFSFRELELFKARRQRPGFGRGIKKELTNPATGRDVFAASSLEFDAFHFLESDGSDTAYTEQPLLHRYELDGRRRWWRSDRTQEHVGEQTFGECSIRRCAYSHLQRGPFRGASRRAPLATALGITGVEAE